MARIGGSRRKSRHKFTKSRKIKGIISLTRYLQKLDVGQKVALSVEPAVQKGMYASRFISKIGVVKGMQGKCYKIQIKDIKKNKTLIVHPIHLKKL
jgi:large subunit ribosomal protein L21e|tara:strand:+ start:112 stop:399 length:288 start_codon:yes stop_codon:yes gene_type:complete